MSHEVTIDSSGIVNGAIITGRSGAKQSMGITLAVRGVVSVAGGTTSADTQPSVLYPPSRAAVSIITADTSGEWYGKLSQLPQFQGWQWSQIVAWLTQHTNRMSSDDLYLEDFPIRIRFLTMGGDYIPSVWPPEVITAVLGGVPVHIPPAPGVTTTQLIPDADGYYSIQDVFGAFPRKVTASGVSRRGTLLFRPHNWICVPVRQEVLQPGELCIYQNGTVYNITQPTPVAHRLRVAKSQLPLYLVWDQTQAVTPQLCTQLAIEYDVSDCVELVSWMTPGQLKSLLQKVIRQGSDTMYLPDSKPVSSDRLLVATWLRLLCHAGGLVPDLQCFVTGAESAMKRAVVSICEDGYVANTRPLALMMIWGSIIQGGTTVLPSTAVLREFIAVLMTARAERRSFQWDSHYPYITLGNISTPLGIVLELLHGMGSFATDIAMVASMVAVNGAPRNLWYSEEGACRTPVYTPVQEGACRTPVYHCLDHHCNPEIGYLIPALPQEWHYDYSNLFSEIFTTVTGVNPRRTLHCELTRDGTRTITGANHDRVAMIRKAQRELWQWLAHNTGPVYEPVITTETVRYQYYRTMEWLPAYIGVIDYTVNGMDYLVTMRSDGDWMIMRKPKRGQKTTVEDSQVDPQARDWIEQQLNQQLAVGVWCTDPVSGDNMTIQLRDDGYYINGLAWHDATTITVTCAPLPTTLSQLMCDVAVVRRALGTILSRITPVLTMNKISREGHGQDFVVRRIDSEVYRLMCRLAQHYPTLLQHTAVTSWKVLNHAGVLLLVDALRAIIAPTTHAVTPPPNPDTRVLYQHQRQAVDDMLKAPRGSIIWINVGMGKTLMVMTYLRELTIPVEYVVYTLPRSAMETVTHEIMRTGYRVHVLTSRDYTPVTLAQGVINLIEHDQLRSTDLTPYMATSLMVVDEFHKTLNHTQRTSMAQELASLALRFVAMSGTIADSDNLDDLTRWLSMVVPYPVNGRMSWVALNSMISKVATTGVWCQRHHVPVTQQMPPQYYELVSPVLGGTNTRSTAADFSKAVAMCYDMCLPVMVDATMSMIASGRAVFVVTNDNAMLRTVYDMLLTRGLRPEQIALMTSGHGYLPPDHTGPEVVALTTVHHSTGYTITKMSVMITSVFFTGQNTRSQLEGRINRIGQPRSIDIIVVYAGLLQKILTRYENARSLAEALTALSTL